MVADHVAVVGAGAGGLAAALVLSARGARVTVFERAAAGGGKIRQATVGGMAIDSGPTVFTLRGVFEELFETAGESLSDHLVLRRAATLARHEWRGGARLDLFADIDRSADAIGDFAGAREAAGFRAFCAAAGRTFRTLDRSFMRRPAPDMIGLISGAGVSGLADLWRIKPFQTYWGALGGYFRDPRLRQLFGRYATYCGSSPLLSPATLMLVAHVEQEGVWLVEGGMQRVAAALQTVAAARGAIFRFDTEVAEILTRAGRVCGVRLASGETIEADAAIVNADASAVGRGVFGRAVAPAVAPVEAARRSLSAATFAFTARIRGFPLIRHTVFFSDDYAAEFDALLRRGEIPQDATLYVCAQDRDDRDEARDDSPERLLCLVNAPATGDRKVFADSEIRAIAARITARLSAAGCEVEPASDMIATTPDRFNALFPGTGGALYGRASHGWQDSFRRPGVRTRIPGLYLAGGSAHPGPGVPMAVLSGRMSAECCLKDLASIAPSRATATPGGISTR
jgi:1-hydroxycarotenoid 3,4-desaturase